jgi:hypothetical protein
MAKYSKKARQGAPQEVFIEEEVDCFKWLPRFKESDD